MRLDPSLSYLYDNDLSEPSVPLGLHVPTTDETPEEEAHHQLIDCLEPAVSLEDSNVSQSSTKTIFRLAASCIRFSALLLCISYMGLASTPSKGETLDIYTDMLEAGWDNWSWGASIDFDNDNPIYSGIASMAVSFDQAWAGVYLNSSELLSGMAYNKLQFWVHGGASGGHEFSVILVDEDFNFITPGAGVVTAAESWTKVTIPFTQLGLPAKISGIVWQETTGGAQSTFYMDDIRLFRDPNLLLPEFCVPMEDGPALSIDAANVLHDINPDIYGMNFTGETLAADLRLPVRRFGGNSTTRYNWQNDTSNRASDWFFENIPNDNPNPGQLPDGSASDQFVEQNLSTGTRSILTLPLIGWTPKAREFSYGFSVAKYGAQQEVDPWAPDAGNGIYPDGTPVTGNDPLDTSVAIDPTFVQGWIQHLVNKYGAAGAGRVEYYNLDNEPMLWNSTHRDVHPEATSYDEMRNRAYLYGPAIKAADPGAKTLGPVAWGWTAYFYSALDAEPGGAWWLNPLDRLAHGNVPFTAWYLQQMQAYEQAHGVRILDYLDLHYYPQAPGVSLSNAGNAETREMRLRSTRSLWDPTYVDESWIDEPVRLIPRMREWVDQNYPGTLLAITEYNWGAFDHINGALAHADVLGIFGREGVDLATLWSVPEFDDPVAFAFRMYRNYDGFGSGFGDRSIDCSSTDQEKLAVYSALRTGDNALTLMIVNKSGAYLQSEITLDNFQPIGTAEVYEYSEADLGAIQRKADLHVNAGTFEVGFPGNSITLMVIPSSKERPESLISGLRF